jgi:hypothetical protein
MELRQSSSAQQRSGKDGYLFVPKPWSFLFAKHHDRLLSS